MESQPQNPEFRINPEKLSSILNTVIMYRLDAQKN